MSADHVVQFFAEATAWADGEPIPARWITVKGPWTRAVCDSYLERYLRSLEREHGRRAAVAERVLHRVVLVE